MTKNYLLLNVLRNSNNFYLINYGLLLIINYEWLKNMLINMTKLKSCVS